VKYIYTLGKLSQMLNKNFSNANKSDITKLCSKINNSDFKEWTKHDYMVTIKRFYKWLREYEGQDLDRRQYPYEVKWIRINMKKSRKKLPNELLNIEDVKKIAEHTNNLRDRCLILLLYESGARIGELLNVKIKDVESDKYGALVNLFGKTGARKIRIIATAPAISNWLLEHPKKEDKNSYLFCGLWGKNRGGELYYRHVNKLLKESGEKAGIKKPLNPHHFRHSRATELAKKLTEAQLCQYMGWVQGSQEASTYVHLSGRDMDKAMLELHGFVEKEKEESKFKIIICPRCGIKNDPAANFCSQCSLGLDEKTMIEYDKNKDIATKIGFDIQDLMQKKEFRIGIMNIIAKEYEKLKKL
jgi:site-specific recombinase XerD/ribosomal protein L40E